jgi:hypothetical protein
MSNNADPKFVPSAAALQVVGLKVGDVRTDEGILKLIKDRDTAIGVAENQISVAVFVLMQRGWTTAAIGAKTNYAERTVTRKGIEGMAILRTGEVTRTVAAIRTGNLSKKIVNECTKGGDSAELKITRLERAAVAAELQSRYIEDGSKRAPDAVVLDKVMQAVASIVQGDSEPMNAASFVAAIPHVSSEVGISAKESKREARPGDGAPQTVESHLRAALRDAKAIAAAADEDYIPTPADVKALLDLCSYLNIDLALEPEVAAAIEVLA